VVDFFCKTWESNLQHNASFAGAKGI